MLLNIQSANVILKIARLKTAQKFTQFTKPQLSDLYWITDQINSFPLRSVTHCSGADPIFKLALQHMARRNQQSAKLILLAIIIAPFVWLHDRIGTGGIIIILVIAITTIAIVAYRKGKSKGSPVKSQVKSRQVANETSNSIDTVLASLDRMDMTDYLGKAAIAGKMGKEAAVEGKFDVAWKHYHEQKSH
jgi:hypothetical protein